MKNSREISFTYGTEKAPYLHAEAKVPSIEDYIGKLQASFNIRLAAQNSE